MEEQVKRLIRKIFICDYKVWGELIISGLMKH